MSKFPATVDELKAAGYEPPDREQASICKACKAAIRWWRTPRGKPIPLDLATLTPHWKTCPEASRFRTPRLALKK